MTPIFRMWEADGGISAEYLWKKGQYVMRQELDNYAKTLAEHVRNGDLAIFAGAGLSASVGFVDWAKLLHPFAKDLGLDSKKEDNLVRLAQFSVNSKGGHRNHLNQALIKAFPTLTKPGKSHEILASMPISTYWTTNYDTLIETALRKERKAVDVKWNDKQLPASTVKRDAVVYKMHGDISMPDDAVLTRDDYESYAHNFPGLVNALMGDLTVKTFLFIGFSFSDPNLDHVLSEVRQRYHKAMREHYCIVRKVSTKDFPKAADLAYARAKQDLFIADLKRFNVTAILIEEYSEIPELLAAVSKYSRRDSVFVSGSVADYSPWSQDEVDDFLRAVGELLAKKGKRIVSGLGVGVGNQVVSGAVEHAYTQDHVNLHSLLEVRPFPQRVSKASDRNAIWKAYRLELVRSAGIALFVFGNKEKNPGGPIVDADGMRDEFDLALESGLFVIPIGGTGAMAGKLAAEVLGDFSRYYPQKDKTLKKAFEDLNSKKKELNEYLPILAQLIERLTEV